MSVMLLKRLRYYVLFNSGYNHLINLGKASSLPRTLVVFISIIMHVISLGAVQDLHPQFIHKYNF
jgi:hypothetical protein